MKFLLTSSGISNMSIRDALVELLGKPISEASALCIPTGTYAMPGGAGAAWRVISGKASTPMCELGWKSLGVLELTALTSIKEELWVPLLQEIDALLTPDQQQRFSDNLVLFKDRFGRNPFNVGADDKSAQAEQVGAGGDGGTAK